MATTYSAFVWPPMVYVTSVQVLLSRIGGTFVPGPAPPLRPRGPDFRLTSISAGTFVPPPAPPMVIPPPLRVGRVSFQPAANINPVLTNVSYVTTQRQINNTFRIVDLRLNNQAP